MCKLIDAAKANRSDSGREAAGRAARHGSMLSSEAHPKRQLEGPRLRGMGMDVIDRTRLIAQLRGVVTIDVDDFVVV